MRKLLQTQIALVTVSWGIEKENIHLHNYGKYGADRRDFCGVNKLENGVIYQSAVALQIASKLQISALEISKKIVLDLENQQSLDFQAQVMPQGIINFRISDRALANWLEFIKSKTSPQQTIFPEVINYFPIQAAHARCCSLLKLGAREKVIELKDQAPNSWQISLPSEIPWLDTKGNFRLLTSSEINLVNLLVNLVDEFDSFPEKNQPQKWLKLATEISKSFAYFDRNCLIFGEIKLKDLPLAQARLGLVAITQWGLQKLLEEYLGAIAQIS